MPTKQFTTETITAAIDGYQFQKSQIDAKVAELRALLAGGSTQTAATPEPAKRKQRKMSAAGRKAISDATKKRWAAFHKAEKPAPAKKKMSPARKAALVASLAKARAARAAKRSAGGKVPF